MKKALIAIALSSGLILSACNTVRGAAGDSVRVGLDEEWLVVHQPGELRVVLLPESGGGYFVPQLNGTAEFRERGGRMSLTVRDGLGSEVLTATRARP